MGFYLRIIFEEFVASIEAGQKQRAYQASSLTCNLILNLSNLTTPGWKISLEIWVVQVLNTFYSRNGVVLTMLRLNNVSDRYAPSILLR